MEFIHSDTTHDTRAKGSTISRRVKRHRSLFLIQELGMIADSSEL